MSDPVKVWTYWEGPSPAWIDLCLATIRQHCAAGAVHFHVTPETVWGYIPRPSAAIVVNLRTLQPAIRCDYIRAALLARHGGLYMDADTVCLQNPAAVASDHDLVCTAWDKAPRRVLNGYVYARPGSQLAKAWLAEVETRVASGRHGWAELGEKVLTPLVDAAPAGSVRQLERAVFLPLDVDAQVAVLFGRGDWRDLVKPSTVCFGLNHSWMMHHRRGDMLASPEAMAASPLMIHQLLTHARAQLQLEGVAA